MKKIINICLLSYITLLTACSGINSVAPFDKEQAKILLQQSAVSTPARQGVIIAPRPTPEERRHIDTQLIGYSMEPDASANYIAKKVLNDAATNCKQIDTKIISSNKQFTIYQYNALGCKDNRPDFLIGKAFNGEDGVYVVSANIKELTTLIKSAQLVYSTSTRRSP